MVGKNAGKKSVCSGRGAKITEHFFLAHISFLTRSENVKQSLVF